MLHLSIAKCGLNWLGLLLLISSRSDEESYSETKIRLEDDEGYADDGQGNEINSVHISNACVKCIVQNATEFFYV